MNQILVCEDSIEGILTGVYQAYEWHLQPSNTVLVVGDYEYQLFSEYHSVVPDEVKTQKVVRTILNRLGSEAYTDICRCMASEDENKAQAIYQTIVLGISGGRGRHVMGDLANDYVRKVFELSRASNNEILHLHGFLRFTEMENNVLFSTIGPKNNIITFIAPHFADRLPLENFVIYDEVRQLFVVHPAKCAWSLVTGEQLNQEWGQNISDKEKEYQELFTFFCHKIAIKERKNLKLQQQMLPLRFQKYMTEF